MSTATLSHFFASLSLLTWAGTLTAIVLAVVRQLAGPTRPRPACSTTWAASPSGWAGSWPR